MQRLVNPARLTLLFVIMAVILIIYVTAMCKLQLFGSAAHDDETLNTTSYTTTLKAARGDILDRNGQVLVTNRATYNIVFYRNALLSLDNVNDVLLDVINTAKDNGVDYTDTFPMTTEAPFDYVSDMTDTQRTRLDKYIDYFNIDPDISASDLFVWMKEHYGISYTTSISDARLIIGIRYEMEIRAIMNLDNYVFAKDVSNDFMSIIAEKNYTGISIEASSVREYKTDYACHILGYTGLMTAEEYETYASSGYPMDAIVGKSGVELEYENYLHGVDGSETVTVNSDGTVVGEDVDEPQPGDNVYLSIDIGMQETAEKALESTINSINKNRDEDNKATGGAVVVVEVDTGEVMTCASYPTYDLKTFTQNYDTLKNDSTQPLFNRATQGTYNPGSTFKMVTAFAGLCSGTITRWTTVNDTGVYTAYSDYQPTCWIYQSTGKGHGILDVVGALENSCNYFFYWLGDHTGIDAISEAATKFGLAQKTGIELYEETGTLATSDYKENTFNEDWYAADTLITAIGQGYNLFTPVQLANYVATIANGGTLNKLTLFNSVKSADYSQTLVKEEPEVRSTISETDYIKILQEGMRAVASSGTASSVFGDYPVEVAAKTGTVQSDSSSENNGVFVCYAPADDPQIAISIVVEKGTSGSTVMGIAKEILDYYFQEDVDYSVVNENTLLN